MTSSVSNISTPMTTWFTNIRQDIYNILTSYKHVVIHRAKLAGLCTELLGFHKSKITVQNKPVTPNENNLLRNLSQAINEMKSMYQSLTEQNYVKTLLNTSSTEFVEKIQKFRETFNKITVELNFVQTDPLPINPSQIRIDDMSDCQGIIERIDAIIDYPSLKPHDREVLLSRKAECQELYNSYSAEEAKSKQEKVEQQRIMTPEEVKNELRAFDKCNVQAVDFELQKKIGSGSFADVYYGYQKKTGKIVAVKKLKTQNFKFIDFNMYKREIGVFSSLNHFAILPFVGASFTHPYILVTEFMSGGSLFDRLRKTAIPFDATHKTICALGIAKGMSYMHKMGFIHRDIKSLNILLDANDFPRICDFGMSRGFKPGDLLSCGPGTYRWMAPEVLEGKDYDGKADVYSYAIVLWELLTQDIPFHGLNDFQVTTQVLKGERPLIPQNCPVKLAKLIRRCWDSDPNKRPDFDTIARMFEAGGIGFPGTNQEAVDAYVNQFSAAQEVGGDLELQRASESAIINILSELDAEKTQARALAKLKHIAGDKNWHELLKKSAVVERLVKQMETCANAKVSFDLVHIFYELSKDAAMLAKFIDCRGTSALLELIVKFGSTSMPNVIEALAAALKDPEILLSNEHVAKLSSFLGAADLSIRVSSTNLLCEVIKAHKYSSDSALTSITNGALSNAMSNAIPELLDATLKLLKLLLTLDAPKKSLVSADNTQSEAFTVILALLYSKEDRTDASGGVSKDESVITSALEILKLLVAERPPRDDAAMTFAPAFGSIVRMGERFALGALSVLAYLIRSVNTAKVVFECQGERRSDVVEGLIKCLSSKSKQIVAYSLEIIFRVCSFQNPSESLAGLAEALVEQLKADHKGIKAVAASCLTALLIAMPGREDVMEFAMRDFVGEFLKDGMKDPELEGISIRLAGVISMSYKGAVFLQEATVIRTLYRKLGEEGPARKLAFMAMAAFTSSMPFGRHARAGIDYMFAALGDESLGPYPLVCITNVAADPKGARDCVAHLGELAGLLDAEDDETVERAFDALQNIFSERLAVERLQQGDGSGAILGTIRGTKRFWESGVFGDSSLRLLEQVSSVGGSEELVGSGYVDLLKGELKKLPAGSPNRRRMLRIISRCTQ